jgi:hypothetical protein
MKKKMKARFMSKGVGLVVLVVLLVAALGYFVIIDDGTGEEVQLEAFQAGAQYGFEQAVLRIAQIALTCEEVPVRIENQTFNMIAVDCLRQEGE